MGITRSGIRLKFDWVVAADEEHSLSSVRRLFLKASAAWTPADCEEDLMDRLIADLTTPLQPQKDQSDQSDWMDLTDLLRKTP